MRKQLLFITLTACTSLFALAQTGRQVSGHLTDSSGNPVQNASVKLFFLNSTDTLKTTSSNEGRFVFKQVRSGNFSLLVSSIGYINFEQRFSFEGNTRNINIPPISLKPDYKTLQEVVISTPPIQVKEDTVEYKADSFRVKPNSMVEDMLKKMPGISVDKNGDVTAQGKKVSRVKVNGKDFFGGDVKTATRELPADIIDKVQVIDDYGDQANISGIKDGEPEKIINLQLKKDKNKGVFGRATLGYGTEERYQASVNVNYFNNNKQLSVLGNTNNANNSLFNFGNSGGQGGGGGMGRVMAQVGNASGGSNISSMLSSGDMGFLQGNSGGNDGITTTHSIGTNFRNDFEKAKGSFYGSYSFSRRITEGFRNVGQQNVFEGNTFLNDQKTRFNNQSQNHRASLNLEYHIDSFNYIKISPQFNYGKQFNRSFSDFMYMNKGILTSEGYNGDTTNSETPNVSANILYNHKFRKRGRNIAVNVNLGGSATDIENDKTNFTQNYNGGGANNFLLDQLITQDNNSWNYGVRINYSEPIAKDRFLDLIYSYSHSYTKNDRRTFGIDSTGDIKFNPALSNAFENTFINQRAGANIRTIKKKYNYTLGVSVQPVNLDGYSLSKDSAYSPRNRVNIFPVARMAYNFTRTKTLNFNYFGNARQPGFTQLQPVRDVSNPQYQTEGNPDLKPEVYHNFSLFFNNFNFTSGRVFFTGANLNLIQNQIVNNTIPLGNAGAQLTIPQNVSGYYNVSGFYVFSKPFQNRKYVFSLNGTLNYNHNITLVNSQRNIGNNWLAMQGFNFEFNYKEWLEWGAGLRYGLNSVRYSLEGQPESDYSSWAITSTVRIDIPGSWILRYDFDYTINNGLSSSVSQNPYILNASLEKQVFKKKNGFIRLSAYDIFNQNTSITRQVTGNSIIDTRTNRLGRYLMVTFTYRLNRFQGQQSRQNRPGEGPQRRIFNQ